jgi:hypothetical protein
LGISVVEETTEEIVGLLRWEPAGGAKLPTDWNEWLSTMSAWLPDADRIEVPGQVCPPRGISSGSGLSLVRIHPGADWIAEIADLADSSLSHVAVSDMVGAVVN